jgi:hypothetical protein
MTRGQPKTRLIGLRMSGVAAEALRQQALECGLTMSELIRRRIGGQRVVSRTDRETARSIDQLGRMLKHLYPKGQGWATPEERKRWWSLVTELEHTAKALRASAPGAL